MNTLKTKLFSTASIAAFLAATNAWAGLCQVQTSTFYVRQYCGLTSRGYGEGTTILGTKSLLANSTGVPGGLSSVGAVGVNSSGALLNGCKPLDTVEDGQPAGVIGGECLNAVKFWVQVNY